MNKLSYCLILSLSSDAYDFALFKCTELGMLGCEEKEIPEGTVIRVYFKDAETARRARLELKDKFPAIQAEFETIEDQDWNAKWRESMKPARLSAGWYVSPLWLPPPKSAKHWITIEPKMAFGTGHHETTRLAAQAIITQKRQIKNKRVLDIGTGSGVLCFVAGLCGAQFCLGVEIDPCCAGNMAENCRANVSSGKTSFAIGSINCLKGHAIFDIVVMNMLITESAPLLETVAALCAPGGLIIWSGILTDEYKEAVALAGKVDLSLASGKKENEWWCGTFKTDK
jgi:ribosomal protein L11 methyltransferase